MQVNLAHRNMFSGRENWCTDRLVQCAYLEQNFMSASRLSCERCRFSIFSGLGNL